MENIEKTPIQLLLDKKVEISRTLENAVYYISDRREFVEHNVDDIVSAARIICECRAALADLDKQVLFIRMSAAE